MTTTSVPLDRVEAERQAYLARLSFPDFLSSYVYILEPPPGLGRIRFTPWPHLMALADALAQHRLIVVLKARQVGVSWLLAAYALWTALFHEGAVVLMLSKGEREATDLLGKARFIYGELPRSLTPGVKVKVDNNTELSWKRPASRIVALPATKDAGRSETATLVIQDEADHHDYLDDNYASVKPAIDAGGQLVQVSTSNKAKMLSLFKGLYRGAPGNGFKALFFPWNVRPGRDQAWFDRVKANVPHEAGLTPDLYMEQEYPSSPEEALAPSKAMAFFNRDALVTMLDDCMEPREVRQGAVHIWRKPVVAARYIGFGDVAWGDKGAYSCFVLADYQTGEQVAEVYGRPTLDENALLIHNLVREYGRVWFGVEANGEGRKVVDKLIELGDGDRMFHRDPEWRTKPEKAGWLTDGRSRPVMLADMEEAVRLRQVIPRCKEAVSEMMSFIRDEKGRPGPAEGAYADHVIAWAGLWAIRPSARFSVGTALTSRRRELVKVHGRW